MGRIKTLQVKRITRKLMEKYEDRFTDEFESNREIVRQLVSSPSKKPINMIAGYVTRLKKNPDALKAATSGKLED